MTRGQREMLCEIMGYLWAKAEAKPDDTLTAGYAEAIGNMLAEDETEHWGDVYNVKTDCESPQIVHRGEP